MDLTDLIITIRNNGNIPSFINTINKIVDFTNNHDNFIIEVLKSVNKKDLTILEKIILKELLELYEKIEKNKKIKDALKKIIDKIKDIDNFDEEDLKDNKDKIYPYYTYKVFNIAVNNQDFKQRIQEQLFNKDNEKETPEIQQKRFELYKDIYNSGLLNDEKLKQSFKETIEDLFDKKFKLYI